MTDKEHSVVFVIESMRVLFVLLIADGATDNKKMKI